MRINVFDIFFGLLILYQIFVESKYHARVRRVDMPIRIRFSRIFQADTRIPH